MSQMARLMRRRSLERIGLSGSHPSLATASAPQIATAIRGCGNRASSPSSAIRSSRSPSPSPAPLEGPPG